MRLIDFPSMAELKKLRHAPICNQLSYFCGFPFDISRSMAITRRFDVRLLYGNNEFWTRTVEILGLRDIGFSADCVICFGAKLDFFGEPADSAGLQMHQEVLGYLTCMPNRNEFRVNLNLDVLIFVDLANEEAIMIADDGKIIKPDDDPEEDDIPF